MPRYFFHITDGADRIPDEEGMELVDLDAARTEALMSAREIVAEKVCQGEVVNGEVIEITDEHGVILEKLALRSVVRLN